MLSISIPIVIRDGKAFGFIIISGFTPDSENGISMDGHKTLKTPF